jgi:hypothetical protein
LEEADSENMSGEFSADFPRGQGDCVEIELSVVAVDVLDKLGDQFRNTREVTMQTETESTTVDPPAIQSD